jgi:hypothetical protein
MTVRIVDMPTATAGRLGAALVRSLDDTGRRLLETIGLSDYLAVATVSTRERAAGRISVPLRQAAEVAALIRQLGLHAQVGRFTMRKLPSMVEGTDHSAVLVSSSEAATHAVIFFAVSAELSRVLEDVMLARDHALIGRAFGYPQCCIESFRSARPKGEDHLPSSVLDVGPFAAPLNPVVALSLGISLLFHFPCSLRCDWSLAIARRRLEWLAARAPEAWVLARLGAGISVYGPAVGMAVISRYDVRRDGRYAVHEVRVGRRRTADLFRGPEGGLLTLDAAHRFAIGRCTFADEHSFAAIFVGSDAPGDTSDPRA